MDLLVDVDIALDICAKREPFFGPARDALQLCKSRGGRLWLYAGSVQTLEYSLYNELKRTYAEQGIAPTSSQISSRARALLDEFAADKHWLAALAAEGNVFATADPEVEQCIRALDRFESGAIKLLTRDEVVATSLPDRTITPTQYCQRPAQNGPLPFIDLKTQQDAIRPQLERNIHRVLHHGQYIMGPEIKLLEDRLAQYVGVKHCISASSGTDTLLIAMMALGIGPGDEVITTPFSFIATAEMIALLCAKPVFVDIDPKTYNIDPGKIEAAISSRTRAVMPVSLYGQCADMDAINAIANKHGLPVIEDAAQSFGASYKERKSCALSTIGSTSFFPSKPLGGYGDGGALFTDDDALAKAMREIRAHGQDRRYHHPRIGINGRLDTLQAAILLAKLDRLDWEVQKRNEVGASYTAMLNAQCPTVKSPHVAPHNTSVYAQYTVQASDRTRIAMKLREAGIPTAVHYPVPLHLQPALAPCGYKEGNFPIAESACHSVLSLPMGPDLSAADRDGIVSAVTRVVSQSTDVSA